MTKKQTRAEMIRTQQAQERLSQGKKITLRDKMLLKSQQVTPTQEMLHQDALKNPKTEVTQAMVKNSAQQNYVQPGPTQEMLRQSAMKQPAQGSIGVPPAGAQQQSPTQQMLKEDAMKKNQSPEWQQAFFNQKAEASGPKLTPEKLQQLRNEGISPDTIVQFYGDLNPEFKQKYESGKGQFNFDGPDGKPLSWEQAALNLEAYGDPLGGGAMQSKQEQGGGFWKGVGDNAYNIWDYATAPIDATFGVFEKGLARGMNRNEAELPNVQALDKNLEQTETAAPIMGGIIGEALGGPVGSGLGAGLGKGFSNMLTDINGAMEGKKDRGLLKNIDEFAETAIVTGLTSKLTGVGMAAPKVAIPLLKATLTKMGAVMTNVGDDVLERAFSRPQIMRSAIAEIGENVKAPFLNLSKQIGNTLKTKIDDASAAIKTAKDFIMKNNPGARFDVSSSIDDITEVLQKSNLSLTTEKTLTGKPGDLIITGISQGQAKPLTKAEIEGLTEYVQTIHKAGEYSIDDVLDLKKLYNRIYKELGTNDIGTTSNGQRILRTIRETVDEKIAAAMPDDLSAAYKSWSSAVGAHEDFGQFLTENGQGKLILNDKGESFLNTLWGNTKGQRRDDVQKLSDYLGIDIVGKMQTLKDAQALTDLFPKTGSRTQDILRSFLSKWATTAGVTVGGTAGGIPGAVAGGGVGLMTNAAMSPLVAGKATMMAGDFAKNRIVNSFLSHVSKLEPAAKALMFKYINDQMQE